MNDELKPVRCGCGGEAIMETDHDTVVPGEPIDWKRVVCGNCNIRTTWRHSEAEAIKAWNMAMGNKERTTKVDAGHKSVITGVIMDGHCKNCGRYVMDEDDYCPGCGARLEWK